jgi:hypothetical protein
VDSVSGCIKDAAGAVCKLLNVLIQSGAAAESLMDLKARERWWNCVMSILRPQLLGQSKRGEVGHNQV